MGKRLIEIHANQVIFIGHKVGANPMLDSDTKADKLPLKIHLPPRFL
ncbi:protein of unknown function [Shewanella benthica]|uniref:Uncharacterized protein n=1 Tax=Shewanella benthica TaxID=43661 RepID=A0A330M2P7_9GAMM|nr:protein of unknown function [Shewanella benthica]